MNELKKCPFCGGEADGFYSGKGAPFGRVWIYIQCTSCKVKSRSELVYSENKFDNSQYEILVKNWNKRVKEASV